jgi:ribosome assembly protein RRB1
MYVMLHRMQLNWPCLSFDILRDPLGELRSRYPHTVYMATGTQAEGANNSVHLLKVSDLAKTQGDDDLGKLLITLFHCLPHHMTL